MPIAALHDVVLAAIEARDPDAAREAMTRHLNAAVKYYGEDLDLPLAEVLRQRAAAIPSLAAVLRDVSEQLPT